MANRDEIDVFVDRVYPSTDLQVPDGLDGAFLGVTSHISPPAAIYSIQRCIDILSERMSREEAIDHFYFNVIGGSPGSGPIFIDEIEE
tara:strand:+ start:1824 stop:2087 length:264 start_codon:yes stop_codon:yes gene_type:complete